MTPDSLTNRLHDIQELDTVSVWPLATGWWLVLTGLVLLALLYIGMRRWHPDWHRYLPRHGWSKHAARELGDLRLQVGSAEPKALAAQLSELLRRIAIARCGRDHCAGLHGESWLSWLTDHDPDGFDWRERGHLLLELPYAPPAESGHQRDLRLLIDAALAWTACASHCTPARESSHGL